MKSAQRRWTSDGGWTSPQSGACVNGKTQLVLMFGSLEAVHRSGSLELARSLYPNAHIAGCSTAGEIEATSVYQDSVVMTALAFDHSSVGVSRVKVGRREESFRAGQEVVSALPEGDLTHILLFSDGLKVNGTFLVEGAAAAAPPGVNITGGCAGDQDRMQITHLWCDSEPETEIVVAVGLYGDRLRVHTGVTGAWGPFGPERLVTKAHDNVLYELDGHPALPLYKSYLGDYAAQLPASGLLFPLMFHAPGSTRTVLRALTGFDEAKQSIIFFGDIVEGRYARFMRGTIERLLEDTSSTARRIQEELDGRPSEFTLLVSCFGRRHVLRQRIEEELEAVTEVLGGTSAQTGFYSYGEFGPRVEGEPPELHNETMTITAFLEE